MQAAAESQQAQEIAVREAHPDDTAFVFNSWLKSYRQSAFARGMRNDVFFAYHHAIIAAILERDGARLVVATPPNDARTILGWMACEGPVLHYVYVKEPFRRLGIARSLAEAHRLPSAFRYTHRTPAVEAILRAHAEALFNPYLVWTEAK